MLMQYGFTHISMDAIIAGFEKCFPETGVSTYQGLSSAETLRTISGKIAPFIRAMIEGQYSGYDGQCAVFDVYQLLPEDYSEHLVSANCAAYWLGSSDCTADERYKILKTHDTNKDYTFYKPDSDLREGCEYIIEQSHLLKQQCKKYGLLYFDTSFDREKVFKTIISERNCQG